MRELKFIENEKYTVELRDSVLLKPYYTLAEKKAIYNDMSSKTNSFDRDFSLFVLTALYCTNIDFEGISDNDIYDIASELGLYSDFKYEIEDYTDMHKLMERDENTYKSFEMLMDGITVLFKDFDMSKIQDGFTGIGGALSNVKGN